MKDKDKTKEQAEALQLTFEKHGKSEDRLGKINECFLGFVPDSTENIKSLTAICGELLGATCALYNRLDGDMLCSVGQWNTPPNFNSVDKPHGHICFDVIKRGGDKVFVARNLLQSHYAKTDPNVKPYKLQTYIGMRVKCKAVNVGSLCVVYQKDFIPSEDDEKILGIIASSIGVEEERWLVEKELRESEKKYRVLFEENMDATFVAEVKTGKIIDCNESAEKLMGRKRSELIGSHQRTLHPVEEIEGDVSRTFKLHLDEKQSEILGAKIITKYGKIKKVEIKANIFELQGKKLIQGVFHDVSKRKRAENALRESEKKYRALYDDNPSMYFTLDKDGKVLSVNEFGAKQLGYTVEELVGQSVLNVFHQDDQKTVKESLALCLKKPKQIYSWEFRKVCKDGRVIWVREKVRVIRKNKGDINVLVVCEDVTSQKQAEEGLLASERKLQTIIDSSTAVIYVKDLDGKYALVNCWFETLFHVNREEVKGKTDHEVFPKDMADAFRANDLKVLRKKGPIEFEEIAPHDDGPHTYVSLKFPLFETDGKAYAVCGISTDISERKKAEDAVNLKSQELEKLAQDLRKLSTQLSEQEELSRKKFARILHEQVGQNLAAMKIKCTDIINEHTTGRPKMKDVISNIIAMIDDTIGSTRKLTSELYPVVLDTLGLAPAVSWYGDLVLKPKKIKILTHIDDFVENLSSEHKLSLFRIIQESFHNIIKHASATEVKIELKKLNGSVRLTIKDNGVGFDFEEVKRKKDKGIGIKLMKERALSIGGDFTVKSDFKSGTVLIVDILL